MTKNIFIVSDTHFFHDKMKEYCDRPENFNDLIWEKLRYIGDDDILIHLGDICIGRDREVHEKLRTFKFKKWLVRGNHDQKSDSFYLRNGWDFVCESFSNKFFGKHILFSHEPREIGQYDLNIHGHFHNHLPRLQRKEWVVDNEEDRNKNVLNILTNKHVLISLEESNYKPILLNRLINKL